MLHISEIKTQTEQNLSFSFAFQSGLTPDIKDPTDLFPRTSHEALKDNNLFQKYFAKKNPRKRVHSIFEKIRHATMSIFSQQTL